MMIASTYERQLAEMEKAAHTLGQRLEESLIGDSHPSNQRVDTVYDTLNSTCKAELDRIFGTEASMNKTAAEGVAKSIIDASNLRVLRWRIENRAEACALALMEAKRNDMFGRMKRGLVYLKVYGEMDRFIKAVIPENPALGWTFAGDIMARADKAVKDSWMGISYVQQIGAGITA